METDYDWVEIRDPDTDHLFYANPVTGECVAEKPLMGTTKESSPDGDWWELWDGTHDLPYYYHSHTKQTVWIRPDASVIPLIKIQTPAEFVKRMSDRVQEMALEDSATTKRHSRSLDLGTKPRLRRHQRSTSDGAKDILPVEETPVQTNSSTSLFNFGKKASRSTQSGNSSTGRPRRLSNFSAFTSFSRASKSPMSSPSLLIRSLLPSTASRNSVAVSHPVLDLEAAAAMNPFKQASQTNLTVAPVSSDLQDQTDGKPMLPASLKQEINQFAIVGFAKKYFATHKRGLFRRRVPMNEMSQWTKDSINKPLLDLNRDLHKDMLKCFKLIQMIMGDRARRGHQMDAAASDTEDMQTILDLGITKGQTRDEIYVQVCKQLHNNPNGESIVKGWEILCVIAVTFPPSKNLEGYLTEFVNGHHTVKENNTHVRSMYVSAKLKRTCKRGAKGKVLTAAEIDRAKEAPFKPSVFGESLEMIMSLQKDSDPDLKIPKIVPFLANAVHKMGGSKSEGIFRVPGDADDVTELRVRIENANYDASGITDPNVPASLLKYWLRDLADPLITAELYNSCLQHSENADEAIALVNSLPDVNRRIALYVICFLQEFTDPKITRFTLMSVQNLAMVFAPNFLRCPSESLTTVFENTKNEQAFLKTLITELSTTKDMCLYDPSEIQGRKRQT